ncbi:MAG: CDP-alcohol phosphatidyltransferase family protein [Bacteroidales bacterium]|nr:CDP-alcohol phosphatidyltransferase family protein [Bacteroidales bacterium]
MFNAVKRNIPNFITLCNLLCGTIAAWQAVLGQLHFAAIFILLGIFFDFFDGLAARALKVASPMGKELDSLADLVTSGVAPGFILFYILLHHASPGWIAFSALLIPLAAAWRLAKFNLDSRQSTSFLGLPAPSNALVWACIGFYCNCPHWYSVALVKLPDLPVFLFSPTGSLVLAVLALICSVLMVSEIPLFALKFKNLKWNDNKVRFIFLISCLLLLVLFGVIGILFIILWYVILSVATFYLVKHV